ncbi:MAG: xanthine dehydrogenase family protein subunit M [Spirochaetes bacterium]|nr:MAG: xanthine dehydrogenase family protein subunit M [Spirochaetota bacterium]
MSSSRIITQDFDYIKAVSLGEALESLAKDGARVFAGGTDLLNKIKTARDNPKLLVDITGIEELKGFSFSEGCLLIGAAVRLSFLEDEKVITERYPALHEAIKSLGSVQIRNMATLAGNLCNASPIADTAPPLMVYDAEVEISRLHNTRIEKRIISLKDFFTGPGQTVLQKGEMVTGVRVPEPMASSGAAFGKIARVTMDLAKVNCAVWLKREEAVVAEARIAVGGAAPVPVRVEKVEKALAGMRPSSKRISQAAALVGENLSPISDVRSTAKYRTDTASVLIRDTFFPAWKRSGGEEITDE